MLTKHEGRNYVILYERQTVPEKLNKNKVDKSIDKIENAAKIIADELTFLYENDYEVYRFVCDEIFDCCSHAVDEGKSEYINELLWNIDNLKETLSTDDEKLPEEELITLPDLGYHKGFPRREGIREKSIEETEEKSVIEEIQMVDGSPLRRVRTINWEKIEGGRQSTSITYRKKPIGKKLLQVIQNTYSSQNE